MRRTLRRRRGRTSFIARNTLNVYYLFMRLVLFLVSYFHCVRLCHVLCAPPPHPPPRRVRDNRRGRKKTTRRAKKYAPIQSVLVPMYGLAPDHVRVSSGEDRKRNLSLQPILYKIITLRACCMFVETTFATKTNRQDG